MTDGISASKVAIVASNPLLRKLPMNDDAVAVSRPGQVSLTLQPTTAHERSGLRVSVIAVGDELLSGRVADNNSRWLARELTALGLEVHRLIVVSDSREEIGQVIRECSALSDLVVVAGGLGGTADDVTREGISDAFGVDLVLDDELVQWVATECKWSNREFAMRSALLPRGAQILANPLDGAFPFQMSNVLALPGFPEELRSIMHVLSPGLRQLTRDQVVQIACDATEDRIAAVMDAFLARHTSVRLGSYPVRVGDAPRVNLVLRSRNDPALHEAVRWLRRQLAERNITARRR